jgi:hypothetical protein
MSILVLLLVMSPALVSLSFGNVELRLLAWYEVEALLIAALIAPKIIAERRWALRLAWCAGFGLHILAAMCGVLTDSGACDSDAGLPGTAIVVLLGTGFLAEVLARMEQRRCSQKHRAMKIR